VFLQAGILFGQFLAPRNAFNQSSGHLVKPALELANLIAMNRSDSLGIIAVGELGSCRH
jgi:hypothetical protein